MKLKNLKEAKYAGPLDDFLSKFFHGPYDEDISTPDGEVNGRVWYVSSEFETDSKVIGVGVTESGKWGFIYDGYEEEFEEFASPEEIRNLPLYTLQQVNP